ncbi:MAG: hypothetical protein NTW11_01730 [Candidatus Staskawiczbacteria bacterium]|nr:hypothetical protein [Candidatus Staskawiczbacteria bacterium]
MKPTTDILKSLGAKVQKVIWFFGLHAFSFILLLILIDLIFGFFVFYNYVYLAEKQEPKVTGTVIKFDTKAYQNVLTELQARE